MLNVLPTPASEQAGAPALHGRKSVSAEVRQPGFPAERNVPFENGLSASNLISWGTKGGLAITEYGLISGSNFVLSVLLARWMSPQQYGAYALAFSVFLLVSFIYQSLLLEPMSVFGGSRYRECVRGYVTRVMTLGSAVSGVICGGFLLAALATRIWSQSSALSGAFAGLAVAAPCICMSWMVRRAFYLRLSPGPAAAGAMIYFLMLTGGLVVLRHRGMLSPGTAFLLMAAGATLSSVFLVVWLWRALPKTHGPSLAETWQRHWEYGRWALATSFLRWVPNYIYFPILATFAGMGPAAELRALVNFTAPVDQTATALTMLLLPYAAARKMHQHRGGASGLARKITLLFIGGALLYWLVILPFQKSIFAALYGGNYTGLVYLLPFVALESVLWSAGCGPAIVLRSMESPRSVFLARCASTLMCLLVGIPATHLYGIKGAVLGMALSSLVMWLAGSYLLRRKEAGFAICAAAEAQVVTQ